MRRGTTHSHAPTAHTLTAVRLLLSTSILSSLMSNCNLPLLAARLPVPSGHLQCLPGLFISLLVSGALAENIYHLKCEYDITNHRAGSRLKCTNIYYNHGLHVIKLTGNWSSFADARGSVFCPAANADVWLDLNS